MPTKHRTYPGCVHPVRCGEEGCEDHCENRAIPSGLLKKEGDPFGVPQHAPGSKLDHGKVRPNLILDGFGLALLEVAKVGTHGASKYSEGGWQHVLGGIGRYRAAADRHRLIQGQEMVDPTTDLRHLAQEAWNVLATLELTLRAQRADVIGSAETRPRDTLEAGSR